LLRGISDYTVYRKDRNNKIGGGVCIFAKSSHSISPMNIDSYFDDLEVVAINLSIGNDVFTIVNIYRPPSLLSCLKSLMHNKHHNKFIIVAGQPSKHKLD